MENAVPRYYFRLEPDGPVDLEGEDLANVDAARDMAALVVRDLTKNCRLWAAKRLVVLDEAGSVVHEAELVPREAA